jgi:hypothetical protein
VCPVHCGQGAPETFPSAPLQAAGLPGTRYTLQVYVEDSPRPRIPLSDYLYRELRYRTPVESNPTEAVCLLRLAEEAVRQRWQVYEEMASRKPSPSRRTAGGPSRQPVRPFASAAGRARGGPLEV